MQRECGRFRPVLEGEQTVVHTGIDPARVRLFIQKFVEVHSGYARGGCIEQAIQDAFCLAFLINADLIPAALWQAEIAKLGDDQWKIKSLHSPDSHLYPRIAICVVAGLFPVLRVYMLVGVVSRAKTGCD
ncbi:MAG: hypothetical protein RXR20_00400 [Paraburkholderia sp.]